MTAIIVLLVWPDESPQRRTLSPVVECRIESSAAVVAAAAQRRGVITMETVSRRKKERWRMSQEAYLL
jgi:hypothetical protein